METKLRKAGGERIRRRLKFDGCLVIEPLGKKGGLMLLWKQPLEVEVLNYSRWHINAWIKEVQGNDKWLLTGFYGQPETNLREETWSLLSSFKPQEDKGWCVIGDFNEIAAHDEKSGGKQKTERQMARFREVLEEGGLFDLGWKGDKYTWSNKHEDETFTKERLDRAVANIKWKENHSDGWVEVLVARCSDHRPILLHMNQEHGKQGRHKKLFRFEAGWSLDESCEEVINSVWKERLRGREPSLGLNFKLNETREALVRWSKQRVSDHKKALAEKSELLKELQKNEGSHNIATIKVLQKEIGVLLETEDVKWRQRAKVNWYQLGDKNTKFFHSCANERRKNNRIQMILDEQNRKYTSQEGLEGVFKSFFERLFASSDPRSCDIEECLNGLKGCVTSSMNDQLSKTFTREEIEVAVKSMAPLKSPGPDGFGACFFQKHWNTIGEEVSGNVLRWLNENSLTSTTNFTYLALIPKISAPRVASDFRPISLCNVVYKILAKVLANRLKGVLNEIISPNQSAFIPGRLISDNILVAYEVLHSMKVRKKGKMGSMAIKLDMSKAYDRIEWSYLRAVLVKMGFCGKWIELIMMCVSSVSYSVLVNGKPSGLIKPSRGLRQGDPLSPYLFILCAEGLSSLFNNSDLRGETRGVTVSRGGSRINHLLFADDCILYGRAKKEEYDRIHGLLSLYEKASGQFLNKDKTAVFFSSNTKEVDKRLILEGGGAVLRGNYENYLGLPAVVGSSKYNAFRGIKEKVWRKINNWKNSFLSAAGKEVLIKAVLQAVPTYTMSVFQLPKQLCKELNVMLGRFWWGNQKSGRGVHWCSWERMGKQKRKGGMGYRDLESFNLALLAKQGWRILQNENSIAAKILKEKYYKNKSLLDASLGHRPSFLWRSVWNALSLLKEGLIWKVGNGEKIKIWGNKWLSTPSSFSIQSPVSSLDKEARVCELMQGRGEWNTLLIRNIFNKEEADQICSIPVSSMEVEDRLVWGPSKKGIFSVRSAYHLEMERKQAIRGENSRHEERVKGWDSIWELDVPRKVKLFLWKATNDFLATKKNLFLKKITGNPLCPICKLDEETIMHVVWQCPAAGDVWSESSSIMQKMKREEHDLLALWEKLTLKLSELELEEVAVVMRGLWVRRNESIFEDIFKSPSQVISIAQNDLKEYKQALQMNKVALRNNEEGGSRTLRWEKPRTGSVKANWDAAVDKKQRRVGLGVLIRDEDGKPLVAVEGQKDNVDHPAVAEAQALWKAMVICRDLRLEKVIFEGDAQVIVKAVNNASEDFSVYGSLTEGPGKEVQKRVGVIPVVALNLTRKYCHVFGHYKNECPRLKNKEGGKSPSNVVSVEEQSNNSSVVLAVSGSSGRFSNKWVMDSTCTFHMCSRIDWFTIYESVNSDSVLVGNDMACDIVRIDSVEIKMYDGTVRTLSNFWHIPSLKKNLISLGILDSFDYQYSIASGVIRVYKDSLVVMTGNNADGLYFLLDNTVIGGAASSNILDSSITRLWHT
ncbi:uncharacterized protein LOC118348634 [Juglans regia]|uniref:Uncharacterized protein LOC118348634 n=1 Tax=Juglans regia TaxID=51240 RepID=A0A6P9ERU8_JUGRE|nr:uncharacterized protein LOC118348634 [Juglans regia]